MQYGNFYFDYAFKNVIFVFKSYYVVWKRCLNITILPASMSFKSYYVVWKHFFKEKSVDEVEIV